MKICHKNQIKETNGSEFAEHLLELLLVDVIFEILDEDIGESLGGLAHFSQTSSARLELAHEAAMKDNQRHL